jgi:hypothetical protein
MAFRDLVRVAIPTTGAVLTITLGAAVADFLTFAGAGAADGEVMTYAIHDPGVGSEIGSGTYHSAGPTFDRTTVYKSSNSNARISLSGNAQIYCSVAAEDLVATGTGNLVRASAPSIAGATLTGATLFPGSGRIDASGNMGLGITPSYKMHVVGADGIIGLIAGATKGLRFDAGSGGNGILSTDNTGTASYQPLSINALTFTFTPTSIATVANFVLDGSSYTNAGANWKLIGDGATTPAKYIRTTSGHFQVVNNAYSAVIFDLSDAGRAQLYESILTKAFTVATLPSPTGLAGARAHVTDCTPTTFGAVAVNTGLTSLQPVWCDGTNWRVG